MLCAIGRLFRRVLLVPLVALLASGSFSGGLPAAAAEPGAGAARHWCQISVSAIDVDGTRTRWALRFNALNEGPVSGTVALYAGNRRYDVPLHGVVAVSALNSFTVWEPLVVRFPAPVTLDGGIVTRLDGTAGACEVPFGPWMGSVRQNDYTSPFENAPDVVARESAFRAAAAAAAAIDAPVPAEDPTACAEPYRAARSVKPNVPDYPPAAWARREEGTAQILVILDETGMVSGGFVYRSTGFRALDDAARATTLRSRFAAPTFRCRPAAGAYIFDVTFRLAET